MTKEEAKKRQAELKSRIETYLDDIKHLNDEMSELEAIISKKDDWRDKLVQPDTTGFYFIERDKYESQGFVVEEGFFSERKPEHAFNRVSQAELIKDKMLLMQEMYAFAHVRNEGWIPDWADEEAKWGLAREFEHVISDYTFYHNEFVFGVSVKSEGIAKEMLEEFGERIEEIYNKQY